MRVECAVCEGDAPADEARLARHKGRADTLRLAVTRREIFFPTRDTRQEPRVNQALQL